MACLSSPEEWARALRGAIGTPRLLIVIDDAWTSEDAYALSMGGPNCSYLLTTRLPTIALHFANHNALHLHEWNEEDGLLLLARFAPTIVAQHVEVARTLVRATGGLPLGITLIGKYCQAHAYSGQQQRLRAALERLHSAEERLCLSTFRTVLDHGESEARLPLISLERAITASFVQLDELAQFTLCQLSVFPAKPNSFSEEAALTICDTSIEALDALVDAGLLEVVGSGRYTLHRTIVDYGNLRGNLQMARRRMVAYFAPYMDMYHMDTYALELEQQNIKAALHIAFDQAIAAPTLVGVTDFAFFLQSHGYSEEAVWYLQRAEQAIRHSPLHIDWSYVIAHQEQHTQLLQQRTAIRLRQESKYKRQFSLPAPPQERLHRLLTGPPFSL
ncbi:MAG: hypothetical protein J2P36_35325 [Ktedonobacteraceae bacterium]|nr:hypothetical protein [Ktedonobacteraceae bacterium]